MCIILKSVRVFVSGVISFVLYRHLSWNRPQTLSDKFSNDESTGYIDDTAFRVSFMRITFKV